MLNGLTSVAFRNQTAEEIVRAALDAGLSVLEFDSECHLAPEDSVSADRLGAFVKEAGLTVSSYATDFTLGDSDSAVFELYCRTAVSLGASCVRIRCDRLPSRKIDAAREAMLVAEAEKILAIADMCDLSVALDLCANTLCDDGDRALAFLERVHSTRMGVHFRVNRARTKEYNLETLYALTPYLTGVYLSAVYKGCKVYPLKAGFAMTEELVRILCERGVDCPVYLECVPDEDMAKLAEEAKTLTELFENQMNLSMPDLIEDATVYLVEDKYQIIFCTKAAGCAWVRIGNVTYTDSVNGCVHHKKKVHRLIVPTALLNREKSYTIGFRRVIGREPYSFELGARQEKNYSFRVPSQSGEMRIVMIGDAHGAYDMASSMAHEAGDMDLLILNGDIAGFCNQEDELLACAKVSSRVSGGQIPVVYARGNHDTRGDASPLLSEYVGTDEGRSYFTFRTGNLFGIVLDYGEDKCDDHPAYGGLADYEGFRERQMAFLDRILEEGVYEEYEYVIAICHVGPDFQNDRAISAEWMARLSAICPDVFFVAHAHLIRLDPPSEVSLDYPPLTFPTVTGSKPEGVRGTTDSQLPPRFIGTVADFFENGVTLEFLDDKGISHGKYNLPRRPLGGNIF